MQRILRWLGRSLAVLASIIGLALLTLCCRDGHRLERFEIGGRQRSIVLLSAMDQLAVYVERDRAKPRAVYASHNAFDDTGVPQRDDRSSYLIAIQFHPWFQGEAGWTRGRGLKHFEVAPLGPDDQPHAIGQGVIFPTWWPIAMLAPTQLWLGLLIIHRTVRWTNSRRHRHAFEIINTSPAPS